MKTIKQWLRNKLIRLLSLDIVFDEIDILRMRCNEEGLKDYDWRAYHERKEWVKK